jgi:hypothetical protein
MASVLNSIYLLMSRCCKCFFYAPSIHINSLCNCCSFKIQLNRPIAQSHILAIELNESICRFVSSLFLACFPSDIFRIIISSIVNSSQRVFFAWRITNIKQKILKNKPSFTNLDSNSSIPVKSLHRRIFASPNHCVPSSPFFCSFPVYRMFVCCHKDRPLFREAIL